MGPRCVNCRARKSRYGALWITATCTAMKVRKLILGDWWSGEGPDATTWRFNLKAEADDEVGHSFPVHVPNDPGRDDLLRGICWPTHGQGSRHRFM